MQPDSHAKAAESVRIARQLHQAGDLDGSALACEAALREVEEQGDALNLLGIIASQKGDPARAVTLIGRALRRDPGNANYLSNLAIACLALGRADEAIAACDKALSFEPNHVAALSNRGNALQALGRYEEAVASYRQLLRLRPDHANALNNLGNALRNQGKLTEAAARYREALALRPGLVPAQASLARTLNDIGVARRDEGRGEEAIEAYREALELQPDLAETHYNLGVALKEQGRADEALACFDAALARDPALPEARWGRVIARIPAVQGAEDGTTGWREAFDAGLSELNGWFQGERVTGGQRAVGCQQPFHLAYREEDHRERLARYGALCARLMGEWQRAEGLRPAAHRHGARRRVAIVSGHFYNHSVWHALLDGWTRSLDAERFELHLFHLGAVRDEQTAAARKRAASFAQGLSGLRAWTVAILASAPDVLIYPEIGLDPMTTKLASMRLAPVQAASWGHPLTTGLPTIDRYLSAQDFEPEAADSHYSERLLRLPHLGCFYPPNAITPMPPDLTALGIDAGVPLLLSPGAPFKYTPRQDRLFARIARELGRCQLVFFTGHLAAQTRLLRERMRTAFERAGADFAATTRWIPWQPRGAFYGLMQRADAYLDTIGFSGFNTAMQGVEAGVPIVTREGAFMRGRLASGVLRRMGHADLVAQDDEAYVAAAVRLARDAAWRDEVRQRIRSDRGVLFEDATPVRALEAFLERPQ
jgi:predicted O-linked N-acetylglucosamine transferase (SPINDLY family)